MLSESCKVVSRRFTGRIVESCLIIIVVALGVGAASSGFSLLANTIRLGGRMPAGTAALNLAVLSLSLSVLLIALLNVSRILTRRSQRMRENVGIMMALGASQSSILKLFATEALFISVAGSLLGGLFALPLARSMQSAIGLKSGDWRFVAIGAALSLVPTIVFSILPAWRNSRILPAEALRRAASERAR
jgi:hypothetical protein